jgi:hypothetical protein
VFSYYIGFANTCITAKSPQRYTYCKKRATGGRAFAPVEGSAVSATKPALSPPKDTHIAKKGQQARAGASTPVEGSALYATKPPARAGQTEKGTEEQAAPELLPFAEEPSPSLLVTRKSTRGKGTTGEAPTLPVGHPRGRGRVLPRVLEETVDQQEMGAANSKHPIVVDSPIAAAASTLVYQLAYGDNCSVSHSNQQDNNMVVVAKSCAIEGLTRIQLMPYWWTTAQWQAQYPVELDCQAELSMTTVKQSHHPDESLCYCPSWVAGKKKGRPKSDVREKGVTDHVQELGKKTHKRRVRMFCKLCQKFNHDTKDCFKNPVNNLRNIEVNLEVGESNEYIEGQEGAA